MFYHQFNTLVGRITLTANHRGIVKVTLRDEEVLNSGETYPGWFAEIVKLVNEYFHGKPVDLNTLPVDWAELDGTDFQKKVWRDCRAIDYGSVRTYAWLAERTGCPGGFQAVGQALGKNPVPLLVPCHRVVAKRGLGGFGSGVDVKRALLELEGLAENNWGKDTCP